MKVVFERAALRDLERIARWIAIESPRGAASVIGRIQKSVRLLARFPNAGRPRRVAGTRVLVEPKYRYRIIYVLDAEDGVIRILNVIHPARRG